MNQGMQTKLLTMENESLLKLSVCFENMHACLQIKRLTREPFLLQTQKYFASISQRFVNWRAMERQSWYRYREGESSYEMANENDMAKCERKNDEGLTQT